MHEHTNHLIHETSPYLLQHAHNPVDWYPWGEEALSKAKREDKPIFLSIGYSACHWCHVMEKECFENQEIARLMNDHYINIKVDREERPDLDEIYMNAVQIMTGSGGWPMSVFLTPDLKPYYGGTYFPPQDMYGRSGFPAVVLGVADAYRKRREDVAEAAHQITEQLHSTGFNRNAASGWLLPRKSCWWDRIPKVCARSRKSFSRAFFPTKRSYTSSAKKAVRSLPGCPSPRGKPV